MANVTPSQANEAVVLARRLNLALDALETELGAMAADAAPETVARALAAPVRALGALAKDGAS